MRRAGEGEPVLSPLTREPLTPGVLIPNIALRKRIESHGDDELRVAEAAAAKGRAEGEAKGWAEGEAAERKRAADAMVAVGGEGAAPKRARRR